MDHGSSLRLSRDGSGGSRPRRSDALRAIVFLAGAVRENPLVRGARRALLDFPLTPGTTICTSWHRRVSELRDALERDSLPMIVAITPQAADAPVVRSAATEGITVVPDSGEFRGTGGALADLSERFGEDDLILIANGHAAALAPLPGVVGALLETDADVALHADERHAPTGFVLARVRALRDIPRRGFVDFKEQALARIAKNHVVRVASRAGPHIAPVRTLDGYIRAVRFCNNDPGVIRFDDPLAEEWQATFRLVEPGAHVAPDSRVTDSIVLAGASVGAGATVVRSVVCPGARIPDGGFVCDQIVDADGEVA
jgi:hypothetical protein